MEHQFFTHTRRERTERLLEAAMAGIAADIADSDVSGLILGTALGGGYGRGEGGATADGRPYNDLDFFVITLRERDKFRVRKVCAELSAKWGRRLGVDVDFFVAGTKRVFYRRYRTLMLQELFHGHRVVFGDTDLFADAPRIGWDEIPLLEGERLLLNRGTGLLLAREKWSAEPEFFRRNLNKAVLGAGDALLLARRSYLAAGTDRLAELRRLDTVPGLPELYETALNYKFEPTPETPPDPADFSAAYERVKRIFSVTVAVFGGAENAADAAARLRRAPREGVWWKNLLFSLCYSRLMPDFSSPLFQHPVPKLLPELLRLLGNSDLPTTAYKKIWERFN